MGRRLDVKCITQNGSVVIIEIRLQGNSRFPERILYYWAVNYSKLLKHGEKYDELTPVISINLLNFNLDKTKNIHSCYMLYEMNNKKLLTAPKVGFAPFADTYNRIKKIQEKHIN